MRYLDAGGNVHEDATYLSTLGDRIGGLTADPLAPAGDGLRDHFTSNYLKAMEKNLA
ncbi:hypothetical protein FHX42_000392 [Saccharopolyspora lacisalsi]|uniref:Uncharacterized protein n=1 Tax=Halosaccharopolyspora lacisalsi TaxID=1000566 RepID=A0A839DPS1_9PSEU|nr:hypothetical protein [Halosaccharopolyspora lacisalsi]